MFPLKLFSHGILASFLLAFIVMVQSDDSCNLDFERTITTIFAPQEQPTIQVRTLRRYMLRLLQNMVAKTEEVEGWNTYVYPKRSLEALARAGYLHTLPDEEEENQTEIHDKRSLAILVKNGQLPVHNHDEEGTKRSIESNAKNGEFNKDIQKILDEIYGNMPLSQDAPTKRNVASIVRDGGFGGKRNAAVASFKNYRTQNNDDEVKRSLASLKAISKPKYKKMGNDYETNDNLSSQEYDNLVEELLEGQRSQKRFLGRLPQMGKTKTTTSPKTQFH